jgi:importin subunit alpha-6/7
MGSWCVGLEPQSASCWECHICSTLATAAPRVRYSAYFLDTVTRLDRIVESCESAGSPRLSEAHYCSDIHRKCVQAFLRLPHNTELRTKVCSWMNNGLEYLSQQDEIRSLMNQYMNHDATVDANQFLVKSLMLLQTYMKLSIKESLYKRLAVSIPAQKANSSHDEQPPSFLQNCPEFEGGHVDVVVSLVLQFLPEFWHPEFKVLSASDLLQQQLACIVTGVFSHDPCLQLTSTQKFFRLLSINDAPIDEVIDCGVVPHFVDFADREDLQLRFAALRVLFRVASGTRKHVEVLVEAGVIPVIVRSLSSDNDNIRNVAMSCVVHISVGSTGFRDLFLNEGAMRRILQQFGGNLDMTDSMELQRFSSCLFSLCYGEPRPNNELVGPAFTALVQLVSSTDEKVLQTACGALSCLGPGVNSPVIIESGVCRRLEELVLHSNPDIQGVAVEALGRCAVDDHLRQALIDSNIFARVATLLSSSEKTARLGASVFIFIMLGETEDQIQAVIDSAIVPPFLRLASDVDSSVRQYVAAAICNVTAHGRAAQVRFLFDHGCIQSLYHLLGDTVTPVVLSALQGFLNVILRIKELFVGDREENLDLRAAASCSCPTKSIRECVDMILESGVVPVIVGLLSSSNDEIRLQAMRVSGKMSDVSTAFRDSLLQGGAVSMLVERFDGHSHVPEVVEMRVFVWSLARLCRGHPPPARGLVQPALTALVQTISLEDELVLQCACCALAFLIPVLDAQSISESGACRRLEELLLHHSPAVQGVCAEVIADISARGDMQSKALINSNTVQLMLTLLSSAARQEACRFLCNVLCGDEEPFQAVLDSRILVPFLRLAFDVDTNVRNNVADAICHVTAHGSPARVWSLIDQGCIQSLCHLLADSETHVIRLALQGLANVLLRGKDLLAVDCGNNLVLLSDVSSAPTRSARSTPKRIDLIVESGVVPVVIRLLSSSNDEIRLQAMRVSGKMSEVSMAFRDSLLQGGAVRMLVERFDGHSHVSEVVEMRVFVWSLARLCRGHPPPARGLVQPALTALVKLVFLEDELVVRGACLALAFLIPVLDAQSIAESGACRRLEELLLHHSPVVQGLCTEVIADISARDDMQSKALINSNTVQRMLTLLPSGDEAVRQAACRILCNALCGDEEPVQAVLDSTIVVPFLRLAHDVDTNVRKRVASAICNVTAHGCPARVWSLIDQGCIQLLCHLLADSETHVIRSALQGLANVLLRGKDLFTVDCENNLVLQSDVSSPLSRSAKSTRKRIDFTVETGTFPVLVRLLSSSNEDIRHTAMSVLTELRERRLLSSCLCSLCNGEPSPSSDIGCSCLTRKRRKRIESSCATHKTGRR